MLKVVNNFSNNNFKLIGVFKEDKVFSKLNILEKEKVFFEFIDKKEVYIFLGKTNEWNDYKLKDFIVFITKNFKRNFEIDIESFTNKKLDEEYVLKEFLTIDNFVNFKPFNLKTKKENKSKKELILISSVNQKIIDKELLLLNQINVVRKLQDSPANILSTPEFAKIIQKIFNESAKIKTSVLNKKELAKKGLNLILSVNAASKNEAKMVVAEYKGAPKNKNKIVIIGKGIIFDSGGYDIKRARGMLGMKYDMSGAAISALVLDTIAKLKIEANVSVVLPITDNLVSETGTLPESIYKSYSGRTVEIANTDAEGRLIMADALTYGAKDLKASLLIDIATLTGSIISGLGTKTSGIWSSSDKSYKLFEKSAKENHEKIWRMPLSTDYIEHLKLNTVADTLSCSNTEYSDSNIAAAWLNEFCLGTSYLHCDIAGTGENKLGGQSPLLKTLVDFSKLYFEENK